MKILKFYRNICILFIRNEQQNQKERFEALSVLAEMVQHAVTTNEMIGHRSVRRIIRTLSSK
jgi:hypothetical protein